LKLVNHVIIFSFILILLLITSCNPIMEYAFGVRTAKFDSKGGSSVPEQVLLRNEVITRPQAPLKKGNDFDDWYTDDNTFLNRWNFNVAPNRDITLYAKWQTFGIEINPSGGIDFGSVVFGYEPITARILTVLNNSNMHTSDLTISLSGNNADDFILSKNVILSLQPEESDTFNISPKTNLSAGAYTASVTVTNGGNISVSFNVNFIVTKMPMVIEWPSSGDLVYGDTLSSSELIGGSANIGSFAWVSINTIPVVSNSGYPVIFTPFDNSDNFEWPDFTHNISVTVAPRQITITPDSGQGKVYGTAEPVIAYSSSEALLSGNAFEGALSRDEGSDAGIYKITLGTLNAGSNYSITFTENIFFTITKAQGAAIYSFFVGGDPETYTVIITSVVTESDTGQDYEYAININIDDASSLIWQSENTFSVIRKTDYYVYVRSAENANYETGAVSSGKLININAAAIIVIAIENITSFTPAVELSDSSALVDGRINLSVSNSGYPKNVDVSIKNFGDFDAGSVVWEIFGAGSYPDIRVENTEVFSLNSGNPAYSTLGSHSLRLFAGKNGIPYMINIPFRIVP